MTPVELSQDAFDVDLRWVQGDPISLAFWVAADWSGDYLSQVRTAAHSDTVLVSLTVTAVYDSELGRTAFTMTAPAIDNVVEPGDDWPWDLQQVGGTTKLSGVVHVRPQVTR